MKTKIPFVGPAYTSRSLNISAQRCVNLIPQIQERKSKSVASLLRAPGLKLWAEFPENDGPIRGMYRASNGSFFLVSGDKFIQYYSDKTYDVRGTLLTSSGPVRMSDNVVGDGTGDQVIVIDGTDGWIWDVGTTSWTQISDVDFPICSHIVFMDGFFVVNEVGTQKIWKSASYDGTAWDALEFASAEGSPDLLQGLAVANREIWLIGTQTSEVWYNSGAPGFPFERVPGAFHQIGTNAKNSIARIGDNLLWLGDSEQGHNIVWMTQGYEMQRVSTHAIEYALSEEIDTSDAYAWTYQQEGHGYYVLSLPTAQKTWVYDLNTGLWHERAYRNPENGNLIQHRGYTQAFFNNLNLVGDREDSRIYELDLDTYDDDGDVMLCIRSAPHIHELEQRIKFASLQVDCESGVGIGTGQGSNPQAMLRYSNDGGHTWVAERLAPLGAKGDYRARAKWNRLGMARDRVFELSVSDPVKLAIISATADVEVMQS